VAYYVASERPSWVLVHGRQSIGLKKARPDGDHLLQLAIWNSAPFERLRRLQRDRADARSVMTAPSRSISDHKWEIFCSHLQAAEGELAGGSRGSARLNSVPLWMCRLVNDKSFIDKIDK
jgi:hypothetical protein